MLNRLCGGRGGSLLAGPVVRRCLCGTFPACPVPSEQPFATRPQAVAERQHGQRQHIPHQDERQFVGHRVGRHLPHGQLFQPERCLVPRDGGQAVVAPFLYDGAVLQQQQSRIAADDGLQRRLVGEAEWVVGSRQVAPAFHGGLSAGRQAVESISVLVGVFVQTGYLAEVRVVGIL